MATNYMVHEAELKSSPYTLQYSTAHVQEDGKLDDVLHSE